MQNTTETWLSGNWIWLQKIETFIFQKTSFESMKKTKQSLNLKISSTSGSVGRTRVPTTLAGVYNHTLISKSQCLFDQLQKWFCVQSFDIHSIILRKCLKTLFYELQVLDDGVLDLLQPVEYISGKVLKSTGKQRQARLDHEPPHCRVAPHLEHMHGHYNICCIEWEPWVCFSPMCF